MSLIKIPIVPNQLPSKKGPGRPKKEKKETVVNGIIKAPCSKNNVIEVEFTNILNFKTIWGYLTKTSVKSMEFMFRETDMFMFGRSHSGQSHCYINFSGCNLAKYFCKTPLNIGIQQKTMNCYIQTTGSLTKSLRLEITSGEEHTNLYIKIGDSFGFLEEHKVNVWGDYEKLGATISEQSFLSESDYIINFHISCKYLKKKIKDIKKCDADRIIIEQVSPEDPLLLIYHNKERDGSSVIQLNRKNIKLTSNLRGEDTFRIVVMLSDIYPIVTTLISETVHIFIDEKKDMLLVSRSLDESVAVRTLIKIVDNRKQKYL
jgi:hypothetical protein